MSGKTGVAKATPVFQLNNKTISGILAGDGFIVQQQMSQPFS